jgi:glc operon protein GlcG
VPLTLQEAQTVITGAHERAAEIDALVTVAVVDEGGHLQALGRMNGAAPLSARIAETKAASIALFRRDGAALRQLQEANPGFFAQLDRAVRVPILAGAGAVLILRGDTVLGAMSVSGGWRLGRTTNARKPGLPLSLPSAALPSRGFEEGPSAVRAGVAFEVTGVDVQARRNRCGRPARRCPTAGGCPGTGRGRCAGGPSARPARSAPARGGP